jgi:hypothetical protein
MRQHRRQLQRLDILGRVLWGLFGLFLTWLSVYAATSFTPPPGADPGGVNLLYLGILALAGIGCLMVGYAVRRPDPYVWF